MGQRLCLGKGQGSKMLDLCSHFRSVARSWSSLVLLSFHAHQLLRTLPHRRRVCGQKACEFLFFIQVNIYQRNDSHRLSVIVLVSPALYFPFVPFEASFNMRGSRKPYSSTICYPAPCQVRHWSDEGKS